MKRIVVYAILAVVWGALHPFLVCVAAGEDCEGMRSGWLEASQQLEKSMESYRSIRDGSLGERIQRELNDQGADRSIALGVQAALRERSAALEMAASTCREMATRENDAFQQWRRCVGGGRLRRASLHAAGVDAAAGGRKRLLASLQDLLLDEAYIQYKNYHPPSPPTYSEYDQQPWGTDRNTGYQPYPGYGRYR